MSYKDINKQRENVRFATRKLYIKNMRRLKHFLGARCARCHSTENLELAHRVNIFRTEKIRRQKSNFRIAIRDFKKDSNSLILMCHECHKEYDLR